MKFKVVWADAVVVDANDPADAWAQFCKLNEDALKHPNLHDRFVFVDGPVADFVPQTNLIAAPVSKTHPPINPGAAGQPIVQPVSAEAKSETKAETKTK